MPIARRAGFAICWTLTIVGAGWAGSQLAHGPAHVVTPPASASAGTATGLAGSAPPGSLGAADVRMIVRDELTRQLADLHPSPSAAPAAEPPQDPPPLSAELQAQADEAHVLVEHAIGAGRWTSDDRKRFVEATRALPPPALLKLQLALAVAINRGQVTIPDRLPPYGSLAPPPQ